MAAPPPPLQLKFHRRGNEPHAGDGQPCLPRMHLNKDRVAHYAIGEWREKLELIRESHDEGVPVPPSAPNASLMTASTPPAEALPILTDLITLLHDMSQQIAALNHRTAETQGLVQHTWPTPLVEDSMPPQALQDHAHLPRVRGPGHSPLSRAKRAERVLPPRLTERRARSFGGSNSVLPHR